MVDREALTEEKGLVTPAGTKRLMCTVRPLASGTQPSKGLKETFTFFLPTLLVSFYFLFF